ncbi:hypothetical protein Acsp01_58850 [Actinoplanes sp. NBRC 101535]|nr:hypothetical protein Acsp01_58850 [Actinoplanes sp. NBRC 101535]
MTAVIAGLTTWALWPEPPRQREYLDATACLLTDEKGVTGEAQPVWTSMQEASVAALVRVQYLQVQGPQTARNATAFATSLAGGRCGVIFSVGAAQTEAATAVAPGYPTVRFVNVGEGNATPPANVQVIPASAPDTLGAEIKQHIAALAEASAEG